MLYLTTTGDFEDALQALKNHGGQLYTPKHSEGAYTLVSGRTCRTYWTPNSPQRANLLQVCSDWGIPPEQSEHFTAGRLARWYLQERLGIDPKGTYFHPKYRELAKEGFHWHYTKAIAGTYENSIELDIKSAYATAWTNAPSLLYQPDTKYNLKCKAIETLREDLPEIPKWLRLILLGIIASHQCDYYTLDKGTGELLLKTRHKITWGGYFNAAHRAILKVYRLLEKIDSIAGEFIPRMHTDSITFNLADDRVWDAIEEVNALIAKNGFQTTCKGAGRLILYDLNTGIIGRRWIGAKIDVIEKLRENGHKIMNSKPEKCYYERALKHAQSIANDIF